MNLQDRQITNLWAKRTYNCSLDEYFRRAPAKLKDNIKHLITSLGYDNHDGYLVSTIYECYKIKISSDLCNELIDHYCKK